ncbi:MAG: cation:proton antiporter [Alphaproteobacteria bacterium]|nr:cation:proton antiporter [Alphaproteobacteria bacterium]
MAAPLDPSLFRPALVVLGAAAVVIPVFHRLKLSPVLGFILVGLVVGPAGLGSLAVTVPWLGWFTLTDTEAIAPIADLGVVMLMFMIGLEMTLPRLRAMRHFVFVLGPLQMGLCSAVVGGLLLLLGQGWASAAVLALALAMSSTAVVLQVLADRRAMNGKLGRAALGVLLFQDIAAVPILVAIGVLGRGGEEQGMAALAWMALRAVATVLALLLAGRLVLRPLFRSVARTASPDLFVAACLLVVLGTSLIAAAAGLTPALGALVAGLLLAETEYRRQIEAVIDPFKGLLIGVFLISVGMTLEFGRILAHPWQVLALSVVLVVAKAVVIGLLVLGFRLGWRAALPAGLLLAPGGEFGFVVIGLGITGGLIDPSAGALALIVVAVGLAVIPALGSLGDRLARRMARVPHELLLPEEGADATPRVIIGGYGRVGRTVSELLDAHRIPWIAVDADPDEVAALRRQGRRQVFWGDLANPELLAHLHLDTARALVVTMTDPDAVDALVSLARAARGDLHIIVRARDDRHAAHVYGLGATSAVPETIEASLQLSEAVLVDLGVAMGPILVSIHEKRAEFHDGIRAMAPDDVEIRDFGRRRLRDRVKEE